MRHNFSRNSLDFWDIMYKCVFWFPPFIFKKIFSTQQWYRSNCLMNYGQNSISSHYYIFGAVILYMMKFAENLCWKSPRNFPFCQNYQYIHETPMTFCFLTSPRTCEIWERGAISQTTWMLCESLHRILQSPKLRQEVDWITKILL